MEAIPGELIPIIAIVGGCAVAAVKVIMRADERKLELKLRMRQNGGEEVSKIVEQLRAEIASVRDHGSQYDLSLDTTLHRLERRIEFLESNARVPTTAASSETENIQRFGQNL